MNTLEENAQEEKQSKRRYKLANTIIGLSIGLLVLAALLVTCSTCINEQQANTIFTAIIGLVGTWVGTILAFYYTKDNFEAANKSTKDLVDRVTSKEKLQNVEAQEVMLDIAEIKYLQVKDESEFSQHKLKQILLEYLPTHNRLPVLFADGKPSLIIHRSVIDKFLVEQALNGQANIADLTLDDISNSQEYAEQIKNGYAVAKPTDTLNHIKAIMENASAEGILCSDVFITTHGNEKNPVKGWITNVMISEQAKV